MSGSGDHARLFEGFHTIARFVMVGTWLEPAPAGIGCRLVRLADLVSTAGRVVTSDNCPISDAEAIALEAFDLRYSGNASTRKTTLAEARRFFDFLRAHGVATWPEVTAALVLDYCWAASKRTDRWGEVSQRTAANRQWIVTTIVDELADLGIHGVGDLIGERIPRPERGPNARPLTDRETHAIRIHANTGMVATSRALLVVFAEAGGSSAEIAQVRLRDVDFATDTVHFSGDSPRTNRLTAWGADKLCAAVASTCPSDDERLCVRDRLPIDNAARSVVSGLTDVIRDAGLTSQQGVTARSIRLTSARRILDTNGIEAAARFLGNMSLDNTARALHHRWIDESGDG